MREFKHHHLYLEDNKISSGIDFKEGCKNVYIGYYEEAEVPSFLEALGHLNDSMFINHTTKQVAKSNILS